MPWHETEPVNERMQVVAALQRGDITMVEARRRFGISRKTGYKLWNRFKEAGRADTMSGRRGAFFDR